MSPSVVGRPERYLQTFHVLWRRPEPQDWLYRVNEVSFDDFPGEKVAKAIREKGLNTRRAVTPLAG